MFIHGFLGLASEISGTSVTEFSGLGYGRQPISFSVPRFGRSVNACAWAFWSGLSGRIVGRVIYDHPTGGEPLIILPLSEPSPLWRGASDARDVGALVLELPALEHFPDGSAFTGRFQAGAPIGTVHDDVHDLDAVVPTAQGYRRLHRSAPVVAAADLVVIRGQVVPEVHLSNAGVL